MEFALVLPFLIAIMLMLIDFGRIGFVQVSVAAAAREGVRTSSLQSSGISDGQAFKLYVDSTAPLAANIAQLQSNAILSVDYVACSITSTNENTSVTVSTNFNWVLPIELFKFLSPSNATTPSLTLSSSSSMKCMG